MLIWFLWRQDCTTAGIKYFSRKGEKRLKNVGLKSTILTARETFCPEPTPKNLSLCDRRADKNINDT